MTSYFTTNDGCQIAYQYEEKGDRPTLVLSNSLGTSMSMWQPQLLEFNKHFNVLSYDMRGHGQSDVMAGGYSIDRLGCDLIELLDHLNLGQVLFCGLSIGGMLGQWLSVIHPNRVKALVLANTSANAGPSSVWDTRLALIKKDGLPSLWPMVRDRWVSDEFASQAPVEVQRLKEMFDGMTEQGYVGACAAVRDMDLRNVAQLNALPTLIIAGEKDVASPVEKSEYLLEQCQNAELVLLDAGHLSNIECSDLFNKAVLDFLEEFKV